MGQPTDAGVDERYDRFRPAWDTLLEQAGHGALVGSGFDAPLAKLLDASKGTVLRRSIRSRQWQGCALRALRIPLSKYSRPAWNSTLNGVTAS